MGVTNEVASMIWGRLDTEAANLLYPTPFYNFHTTMLRLTMSRGCMKHMGVTKALRDVILMPEYKDLRYTQSAKL